MIRVAIDKKGNAWRNEEFLIKIRNMFLLLAGIADKTGTCNSIGNFLT